MDDEIRARGGAVPFREFMELALYDPTRGYYASADAPRAGRQGDFLTAPTASGWYAAVLGEWMAEIGVATLVDVGSADGSFLAEIAGRLPSLRLVSVEASAGLRDLQRRRLSTDIEIVESTDRIGAVDPPVCVHACELYDALPVHRVVRRGEEVRELWVRRGEDGLEWGEEPAPREVARYLESHEVVLAEGQLAEVNLAASVVHRRLLRTAGHEAVTVAVDYGYPAQRLYDARGRSAGSLVGYHGHRLTRDVLARPGEQDLTAHINLDDLRRAAVEQGFEEIGCWPLAEMLGRAGLARVVEVRGLGMDAELDAEVVTERQELKRLLDPEGMGSDLRCLVQARGVIALRVRSSLAEIW